MARVTEKASVSVGSAYQYFTNKAAILEDIQSPPLERLRVLVHAFVHSECEEAAMQVALNDAVPLYRHAPRSKRGESCGRPHHPGVHEGGAADRIEIDACRGRRSDYDDAYLAGKDFLESPRTTGEIKVYTNAMTDMFCDYLESLKRS